MTTVATEHDPDLARLLNHVVEAMDPLEVWLFGSRADGRARPDSDYDILVVVSEDTIDTWLDPIRTWRVRHEAGVIADIIRCTQQDFDDERDEIDSLPGAAFARGKRLYAA